MRCVVWGCWCLRIFSWARAIYCQDILSSNELPLCLSKIKVVLTFNPCMWGIVRQISVSRGQPSLHGEYQASQDPVSNKQTNKQTPPPSLSVFLGLRLDLLSHPIDLQVSFFASLHPSGNFDLVMTLEVGRQISPELYSSFQEVVWVIPALFPFHIKFRIILFMAEHSWWQLNRETTSLLWWTCQSQEQGVSLCIYNFLSSFHKCFIVVSIRDRYTG